MLSMRQYIICKTVRITVKNQTFNPPIPTEEKPTSGPITPINASKAMEIALQNTQEVNKLTIADSIVSQTGIIPIRAVGGLALEFLRERLAVRPSGLVFGFVLLARGRDSVAFLRRDRLLD